MELTFYVIIKYFYKFKGVLILGNVLIFGVLIMSEDCKITRITDFDFLPLIEQSLSKSLLSDDQANLHKHEH